LVDFNEETLESLRQKLKLIGQKVKGPISYKLVKRSVNEILKGRNRLAPGRGEAEYDYIYCAGLFDYLQDSVCKQMMEIFYRMLAPGGLMLVTNATDRLNEVRPFRYSMELILDWYLIYRDARQFSGFVPAEVDANCVKVIAENVGANIFLEVEKSENVRTAR
jgi:extracellular factor (EF) 3-hydroxypalmitic acid methyl ester biosynthesis protein